MKKYTKILSFVITIFIGASTLFPFGKQESYGTSKIDLLKDPAGNNITIPAHVEKIISMAPSTTEILIELNIADKIIAADTNTQKDGLLKRNIPYFNMMTPDTETIIALQPDVVFVSGMSNAKGNDAFAAVRAAGICVIDIPSSETIEKIYHDIAFISAVVNKREKGRTIIENMKTEIEGIKNKAAKITSDKKKTVYFEIGAAPYIYTLGNQTFINEMIELIGAENIFKEQKGWISISDETVLSKNPDIILTNVNYIINPIEEIAARPGWKTVNAVKNKQIFQIDTNSSSRPNHNIIKALKEMAKTVYPDIFS